MIREQQESMAFKIDAQAVVIEKLENCRELSDKEIISLIVTAISGMINVNIFIGVRNRKKLVYKIKDVDFYYSAEDYVSDDNGFVGCLPKIEISEVDHDIITQAIFKKEVNALSRNSLIQLALMTVTYINTSLCNISADD